MRFLTLVLTLAACTTDPESIPTCEDVSCVALSCGNLTPEGVKDPNVCTCETPDGEHVECLAE